MAGAWRRLPGNRGDQVSGKYKSNPTPGKPVGGEPYTVFMGPVVAMEALAPGNDVRNASQLKIKRQGDTVSISVAQGVQRCFTDGWYWIGEVEHEVVAKLPLAGLRELMGKVLED